MKIPWNEIIPYGQANAVHLSVLARRLGITAEQMKYYIRRARMDGTFICSSRAGYYFPASDNEKRSFIRMQESQAKSRFATIRTLRQQE